MLLPVWVQHVTASFRLLSETARIDVMGNCGEGGSRGIESFRS